MTTDLFFQFLNFIQRHLLALQLISLFISGALLGSIIYFITYLDFIGDEVNHYLDVVKMKTINQRRGLQAWRLIQKKIRSGKKSDWKRAIIEADIILNDILKMAGYAGKSIDERLEGIDPAQLSNIEEIRQVHQLRHRIVFEPDFSITQSEAEVAIDIYRKSLIELKLIEE